MADNDKLCRIIFPEIAFTSNDWENFIGVSAGISSRLPRRVHKDLASNTNGRMLTWMPKSIKIINGKMNFGEEQSLLLKLAGKLSANAKKDRRIGYDPNSWEEGMDMEKKSEESYWVLIDQNAASEEEANVPISGLRDTAISLLMKYIKCGERYFVFDPPVENGQCKVIGVMEKIDGLRIACGFTPDGLLIDNDASIEDKEMVIFFARKSIAS